VTGRVARPRRRPGVSTLDTLRAAARKFCPPYRVGSVEPAALSITLEDPEGRRPNLRLRHRHERRLFFRANYLVAESSVPGQGPSGDGDLRFRFRGPIGRQRASLRWLGDAAGADEWTERLREPLTRGLSDVEGIESLEIHWNARRRLWQLRLKTLSGSTVGGFMVLMPIPIPLEAAEARGIIGMIDALADTGS
jgi:hypothetical protein